MKVYRMCHLPSGLFFCPSREIKVKAKDINGQERQIYVKSNLSKKGKIYHSKPTFSYIGENFYTHLSHFVVTYYGSASPKYALVPFVPSEWEIQEL